MLVAFLNAKLRFFTKTRAGSIIQRFSKDLVTSVMICIDILSNFDQSDMMECTEQVGTGLEVLLDGMVYIYKQADDLSLGCPTYNQLLWRLGVQQYDCYYRSINLETGVSTNTRCQLMLKGQMVQAVISSNKAA